ncbi:MAG: TrkA family potassium uptake protein [Candidatus Izemoplasmatales bacterium]|jgi:trk system potassium uptake protein TrkA|nr:TrkA family potassium uptake protein [Candidatus Izemoplasmatales bacterium]
MKIVVANGTHEADFIIKKFKAEHQQLTVINSSKEFGEYISNSNHIPVLFGDPTKEYTLDDANIRDADVLIALSENDIDNYVTCITAKKLFGVKRVVCVVRNPKRVDLFKILGIDSVISSTYLLGESIKSESILESFIRTLSIENDKVVITEIQVESDFALASQQVREIHFPANINISCIFRDPDVIIAKGDTTIQPGDKLLVISTPNEQKSILDFIQLKAKKNEE